MKYIPRKKYVIVEKVVNTNSKLVLPDSNGGGEKDGELFKVITVGEDAEMLHPGDLVFIVGYIHSVTHENKKITLVSENDIIMIAKEDA